MEFVTRVDVFNRSAAPSSINHVFRRTSNPSRLLALAPVPSFFARARETEKSTKNKYQVQSVRRARHVAKYVFPREFGLHNVFTSQTDRGITTQKFVDYISREVEIQVRLRHTRVAPDLRLTREA